MINAKMVANKIMCNKRYIAKRTSSYIAGIYATLGFISTFSSLSKIWPTSWTPVGHIGASIGVMLLLWLIVFFFVGIHYARKRRYDVVSCNSGHKVYVQYGDLFSADEVIDPSKRRNIVIPVNRCFDTVVDNALISENTLHGIALNKIYSSGKYNEDSLNKEIQRTLTSVESEMYIVDDKPYGNKKRYPVGTVVDLPVSDKEHYFLLALSTFDAQLNAHTSMTDYVTAIQKLVESCNLKSGGFPVVLPLIGTDLSRLGKDQRDILAYLIRTLQLNRSVINCDMHIIVDNDIKDELAIMNAP